MSEPHQESEHCWCHPVLDYTDPITQTKVWVHRDPETETIPED